MFPAKWKQTNPANRKRTNKRGGTDAPFGPAFAEMPDTRIYTKIEDAFNTEDVPGDMAADESCE